MKALAGLARRPRIVSLTATHFDLPAQPGLTASALPEVSAGTGEVVTDEPATAARVDLRTSVDAHQRLRIEASLARTHDNWASAARELGLHRANLVRLARRLGIRGH